MGCTASKPLTIVDKYLEDDSLSCASFSHFSNSSPQVHRAVSLPLHLVHHLPTKKGDTHHLVSLTSTSYGSLLLSDQSDPNLNCNDEPHSPTTLTKSSQDKMNQSQPEKLLSPDSVINIWELMEGLDDDDGDTPKPHSKSIFDTPMAMDTPKKPSSCSDTAFDGSANNLVDSFEELKPSDNFLSPATKPLWQHLSEEDFLAKLDENVAGSYHQALSSKQLRSNLCRDVRSMVSSPLNCSSFSNNLCCLSGTQDRIVVYSTSLRGIRKTYEDCCSVRMIFKGFRVAVDERDISMDLSYRTELQNALGGKAFTLPQVFIRGRYVGNAEKIKLLNESGELATLLKGFPTQDKGFVCESCGDVRFVPCPNCSGSRKVFEEEQGELIRCPDCNENGLIRCKSCSL